MSRNLPQVLLPNNRRFHSRQMTLPLYQRKTWGHQGVLTEFLCKHIYIHRFLLSFLHSGSLQYSLAVQGQPMPVAQLNLPLYLPCPCPVSHLFLSLFTGSSPQSTNTWRPFRFKRPLHLYPIQLWSSFSLFLHFQIFGNLRKTGFWGAFHLSFTPWALKSAFLIPLLKLFPKIHNDLIAKSNIHFPVLCNQTSLCLWHC